MQALSIETSRLQIRWLDLDNTVLPTTFIIDRDGELLHRFEGPIEARDIEQIIE
ncbi:MAG: hypothetical protein OEU50_21545 [Gammaproteobacteria bacterium]|nr:hypothetical protein [Gammaproteobacteria bacterium]